MALPSGEKWGICCIVMSEPIAKLIEPLLMVGYPAMAESYRRGLGLPDIDPLTPPAAILQQLKTM
jgi:hypothetical protein